MKYNIYLSVFAFFLTFSQTLQAAPPSITTTVTAVSCNGGSNGTITINATGGVAPYVFTIDGWATSQTSNVFSGLTAGTYTVQASDASNITSAPRKVTISQPTQVSFTTSTNNISCNGGTNGRIYFVGSGGVSPYNFSVDGGTTWRTSNNVTGLGAGTYSCLIRDSRLCQSAMTTITLTQPDRLTASANATDITCYGDQNGTIAITAQGGVSPFQYSINGGSTWSSSANFTNLGPGSSYLYRVRDANACLSLVQGVTVNTPGPAQLQVVVTDVTCFGNGNGTISANATGGHHNFNYSIDGGNTYLSQNEFLQLPQGNYSVVAMDGSGCTTPTQNVQVNEPAALAVTGTLSSYGCGYAISGDGESDGGVVLSVSGGNGGNQFVWSDGTTQNAISGLGVGNYAVTVTDQKGCTAQANWQLTAPDPLVLVLNSKQYAGGFGVSCNGSMDGEVYSVVTGGCGPYTYQWSNGSNLDQVLNVASNNYELLVTDANGKQVQSAIFLPEPPPIDFWYEATQVSCFGQSDGLVEMTVNLGNGPFAYSVDGGQTFQTSPLFAGLGYAYAYPLQVSDANGCMSDILSMSLAVPTPLTASVITRNPNNAAGNNGKITVAGSETNLEYSIDGGVTYSANPIFTGLSVGSYTVIVRNTNGCLSVPMIVELNIGNNRLGNQKTGLETMEPQVGIETQQGQLKIQWEELPEAPVAVLVTDLTGRVLMLQTIDFAHLSSDWLVANQLSGHVLCISLQDTQGGWTISRKVFVD